MDFNPLRGLDTVMYWLMSSIFIGALVVGILIGRCSS